MAQPPERTGRARQFVTPLALAAILLAATLLTACEREARTFRAEPRHSRPATAERMSGLIPGPVDSTTEGGQIEPVDSTTEGGQIEPVDSTTEGGRIHPVEEPVDSTSDRRGLDAPGETVDYGEVAYAMSEGKLLYSAYNCNGCHAHGGGDIGPPLMDAAWRYGSDPEDLYMTIARGRPDGMPAYGDRVPRYQIWQLVAYVRSMAGLVPKTAAPGRNDDMNTRPPENSYDRQDPVSEPATRPK